jgi:hypothetical protein
MATYQLQRLSLFGGFNGIKETKEQNAFKDS